MSVSKQPQSGKAKQLLKVTTEDPELAERFNRVLADTVEAMEGSGLPYVFIGGIASGGLGRPRSTHDIDIFVKPEDAELVLRALARKGFRTEKTDPSWLYKGFKEDILVDVIFKSKGEIYLDTEMYQRIITAEFHGKRLRLVSPEDLLIIKAAAHSELTPGHWHDAIALLSHANLDWVYLIRRAKRAPRRILSLLLYAQSNDIWVPNHVIHELYSSVFRDTAFQPEPTQSATANKNGGRHVTSQVVNPPHIHTVASPHSTEHRKVNSEAHGEKLKPIPNPPQYHQAYAIAHLRERLAEDPRTNELDIQIEFDEHKVLMRGEVHVNERKEAASRIAEECFPDLAIENQIRVVSFAQPGEAEAIR